MNWEGTACPNLALNPRGKLKAQETAGTEGEKVDSNLDDDILIIQQVHEKHRPPFISACSLLSFIASHPSLR